MPGGALVQCSLGTDDRHVAEKKLLDLYREDEYEMHGLIPPRLIRESSERLLSEHLADYLADLRTLGRVGKYVADQGSRCEKVFAACRWCAFRDVTSDGFQMWRSRQRNKAASTLNGYQGALFAFFGWLVEQGRAAGNPLERVKKVDTRGKEAFERRALQLEELRRLIGVGAGHRGLVYFFAAYTGLRRREVKALRWANLSLDTSPAFVRLKAGNVKNRKKGALPVHPALVAALREFQAGQSDISGKVFSTMPTAATFNRDLVRAGIPKVDGEGRKLDFHCLRVTFASLLNLQGVTPRSAMELMRHSDMRLTHEVYTDVTVLPLASEVEKLPEL